MNKLILTFIAALLIGLSAQSQSLKKGEYIISIANPERITVNESYFGGYNYQMMIEGLKGYNKFRNEDGTKHKIKNSGELLTYMENRGYVLENSSDDSGYNSSVGATIINNVYVFKRKNKNDELLKAMRDLNDKLEFGIITKQVFDSIKNELLTDNN